MSRGTSWFSMVHYHRTLTNILIYVHTIMFHIKYTVHNNTSKIIIVINKFIRYLFKLYLLETHTHAHTHARTHARTLTGTHTQLTAYKYTVALNICGVGKNGNRCAPLNFGRGVQYI